MSPARHLLRFAGGLYRTARHVAALTPLRLALFAGLALAAAWPLLSTAASLNEFRDAHVLAHYEIAARESILRWHQAPLWDPYYCGGMYLLGTPQARFVSPTFLLTLLFGETRGEALIAFAMMVVGLEGTFRYARDRGATRFGALVAAPVFALGGIFAASPSLGWIGFFGFELLPWIALGVRRSLAGDRRAIILVAAAAAWCVGFGGTYAAPLSVVWCAFEVLEFLFRRKLVPRVRVSGLVLAAIGAALAVGLAAVRLWPIADTLAAAPRVIGGTPSNQWSVLVRMFFFPIHPDGDDGEFYVGFFVVPAVLLGLLRRRSSGLAIAAVAFTWLSAGYALHPSLFAALRELPLYTTLRYPERFLILLGLVASVLCALGVSLVEAYARTPRARSAKRGGVARALFAVASLALIVNVGPLVAQHTLHARGRGLGVLPEHVPSPDGFHQARGDRWLLDYYEPLDRGSLSCWDAYPVPQSPLLRGDLRHEESLSDPRAGTVAETRWSPDRLDYDVSLTRPASLAVNQNWHAGWRTNVGTIRSDRGLLTVDLPAGDHEVSLRFEPRSATGGALASLVAIASLVVLARRTRRARGARGPLTLREGAILAALALAPGVPVLATLALVPQKTFVEPPTTPDGRPVVADAIDPAAIRLDATFDDGIELEAATLSNPDPVAGHDVWLELDWRRTDKPDPGLGVFVHIEPSSGTGLNGDHVLLSDVLDFEEAPPGKTLRDVIPLFVPDDARGKTWKVWVGLWHVRRGGSRVGLKDAGHAQVDGGRVLAATFVPR
ncbi:MAG TPA: hypothetical protein VIY73_17900 [Polyangiaceae bacterium]